MRWRRSGCFAWRRSRPARRKCSGPDDYFHTCGVGLVRACVGHEDGTSHLILQGLARVQLRGFVQERPFKIAEVRELPSSGGDEELCRELAGHAAAALPGVDARSRGAGKTRGAARANRRAGDAGGRDGAYFPPRPGEPAGGAARAECRRAAAPRHPPPARRECGLRSSFSSAALRASLRKVDSSFLRAARAAARSRRRSKIAIRTLRIVSHPHAAQ